MRQLGKSDLNVTPVALGCWPMAGVTTLDTIHEESIATVHAALDAGINHLDTAYVYGPSGESDHVLRDALEGRRKEAFLASKVGIHYESANGAKPEMTHDGRPDTIARECDTLLDRLNTDHVELLYLHSPDPKVPVAESAGAIARLIESGKTLTAGLSNGTLEQIQEFASACPLSAVQLPYNMLQRDIEEKTIPWCLDNQVSVVVYWPLMKGLLAGKLKRDHVFAEGDSRAKYPMYQGEEWQRNQDFVDVLRELAESSGRTVVQIVTRWTLEQPGITSVLCGAKRPWQIEESAAALTTPLTDTEHAQIAEAISARGKAESKRLFR